MFRALSDLYDNLSKNKEDIPEIMLSYVSVSFLITINQEGVIKDIVDIRTSDEKNPKKKYPVKKLLPVQSDKNGSGLFPDFLSGGLDYLTGFWEDVYKKGDTRLDNTATEEKKNKSSERYQATKKLHLKLLDGIETQEAKALTKYFSGEKMPFELCSKEIQDKIRVVNKEKGVVAFRYYETAIPITFDNQQHCRLKGIWAEYYLSKQNAVNSKGLCLVSGRFKSISGMSFKIPGLANGAAAARMIGSNDNSLWHYCRKTTSDNHPISFEIMRKAELAMDYLNDHRNYIRIGTTEGSNPQYVKVYYWATGEKSSEAESLCSMCFQGIPNSEENYEDTKINLINAMARIAEGKSVSFNGNVISPDVDFYLLGLEGNSGRGVLSFFYHNTLGGLVENLHKHYVRTEIPWNTNRTLATPFWILKSVIKDENEIKTNMVKGLVMSILNDTHYPDDIINRALQREHVGEKMHKELRASILQAYIVQKIEEGISMNKEEALDKAKSLGILFAWYEYIQYKASGKLGSNIKDRFYKKAMETPALVFPSIDKLASAHIKAIRREGKSSTFYEKKLASLYSEIGIIPTKLTRDEQCAFVSGYYTQRLEHLNGSKGRNDDNQIEEIERKEL